MAGPVEYLCRFTAGLLVKITLVGNPGAARILQPQRFRFGSDTFRVRFVTVVIEVGGDRCDSAGGKFRLELLGRQSVRPRQFHVFDSPTFHLIECAGDIFRKLFAQAVELETDLAFE
jgi:hypothetical protein